MIAYKEVVNLFSYLSSIAALVFNTKNLQFATSWILQNAGESCGCSWYQNQGYKTQKSAGSVSASSGTNP